MRKKQHGDISELLIAIEKPAKGESLDLNTETMVYRTIIRDAENAASNRIGYWVTNVSMMCWY